MFKGKKVTVIVVAAGRGSRFGGDLPKQFLKIGNSTVLERAIEPFQKHSAVDGIIVAASEEYLEHCRRLCSRFDKTEAVVCGGAWMDTWAARTKADGAKLFADGLIVENGPTDEDIKKCEDLGEAFVKAL